MSPEGGPTSKLIPSPSAHCVSSKSEIQALVALRRILSTNAFEGNTSLIEAHNLDARRDIYTIRE